MSRNSILILAALLVGCVSAEKRYEQAQQAEAAGRWAAAADLYIDALRRDPNIAGAREGLKITGGKAVAQYLATIADMHGSERFARAVDEFKSADSLIKRAASASVALEVPADYAQRRRATYDHAMEQALATADAQMESRRFDVAATSFAEAERRFEPSSEQRARAREGQYRALLGAAQTSLDEQDTASAQSFAERALSVYGEQAMESGDARALRTRIVGARYVALLESAIERAEAGRYQEAYSIVGDALAVYGEDAEESADARALRESVIAHGTVRVAAAPVWRSARAKDELPPGFLDEVNDRLEDGPWANPPLFVAPIEAKEVRDALRAIGAARSKLSNEQAVAVGTHLDADFVVLTYVRRSVVGGGTREPVVVAVATKDQKGAEILVYSRRTLVVDCVLRIVRVSDGEVVADKSVRAEAVRKMRYAVKRGDPKGLLLTEEQHRLLAPRRLEEADRRLERDTTDALAKALGVAVYDEMLKQLR